MTTHEPAALEISIDRTFDVPPEAVFAQWLDAEAIKDWFAPATCTGLSAFAEPRVGGAWMVEFQASDGQRFTEHGSY